MAAKNEMADVMVKFMKLVGGVIDSFVLKAVLDLGIPDMLQKAGGQLTLDEIAARLPSTNVNLGYLDRIMTFAALLGIFTEVSAGDAEGVAAQNGQKKFSLTPISSIVLQKDGPNSLVNLSNMILSKTSVETFLTFSEAVLTGTSPFEVAHGEGIWDYGKKHVEWDIMFNKAMVSHSSSVVPMLVQSYRGFEGVKVLVDVGGGTGTMVSSITKAYPSIRGINFDQPHVIAEAPKAPGVTHVGGDMFEKVPEGDAIILKLILHDWSDEESILILKNCYKALTEDGKVIIVEVVLAEPRVLGPGIMADMIMLALTATGKERTASEWRQMLKGCGFPRMEINPAPANLNVIEGYKS